MPVCLRCHTYYSRAPCPHCHHGNADAMLDQHRKQRTQHKSFLLTSTPEELDFIWAQISQATTQRVQRGGALFRHGSLVVPEVANHEVRWEWVASTFTQGFSTRAQALFPGTQSLLVVTDTTNQGFRNEALADVLDDVVNANKRIIQTVVVVWLVGYPRANDNREEYKLLVTDSLRGHLSSLGLDRPLQEYELPIYSPNLFTETLRGLLADLVGVEEVVDVLPLPLRPLFRTRGPEIDPNAPTRVFILDQEPITPIEPVTHVREVTGVTEEGLTERCIACGTKMTNLPIHCVVCQSSFCARCVTLLSTENGAGQDFCLGSIYHGLHRPQFRE